MRELLREVARPWGVALAVAGLVWTAIAGLSAGRYVPSWFDPDDGPCATDPDGACAAALRSLWWWVGAGGAIALVGVGLVVWSLDAAPDRPVRRLPALVHALVAAVIAPLLLCVLSPIGFFVLLGAGAAHALVAVVLGLGLLEAVVLYGLDAAVGELGPSPRWRAVAALAVAGLAFAVTAWDESAHLGRLGWPLVLRHLGVVALGVLLTRFLAAPGTRRVRGAGLAAGGAAALALAAVVLLPVVRDQAGEHRALERAAFPPVTPPVPAPAVPTPTAVPEPTPAPVVPPAPVDADTRCAQQDLDFAVSGVDGAMGSRAAALVATNTGPSPCWLEGVPVVVLQQGGRPLALQVGPGQTPDGAPAQVQRVGVAPGGTAVALLTWRSYGGWADQETPQALTVALDASTTLVAARLPTTAPAPFDIADGGAWGIAPWAPPGS